MKHLVIIACLLLILCCSYANASGLFSDLLPATPTPTLTPTPTPSPTPVILATPTAPAAAIPDYFMSAAVTQLLGTPIIGNGMLWYSDVAPQNIALFLMMMDQTQIAEIQYNPAAQSLTIIPVQTRAAAPAKPADAKSYGTDSYYYHFDDCTTCEGTGECNHCFGDGELYCTGGCIGGRCIACDDGQVLVGFNSNGDPKYRKCSQCNYGDCKKCGGDGYIDCNYCSNGDCPDCS